MLIVTVCLNFFSPCQESLHFGLSLYFPSLQCFSLTPFCKLCSGVWISWSTIRRCEILCNLHPYSNMWSLSFQLFHLQQHCSLALACLHHATDKLSSSCNSNCFQFLGNCLHSFEHFHNFLPVSRIVFNVYAAIPNHTPNAVCISVVVSTWPKFSILSSI